LYVVGISWYTTTRHPKETKITGGDIYRGHLVFLSSLSFSTTTGAAGILNHNSLNLLVHLSVLALRGGDLFVNASRNINKISTLVGTMARHRAISTNARIALSVA
jgi:hypothetical protein